MGQDTLFNLLSGFVAVSVIWFVHRLTPFWRNKLQTNSKLGKLGTFNTAVVSITFAAILICVAAGSFFLLVVGFVAVPIVGVTMLIEIIWGWFHSKHST